MSYPGGKMGAGVYQTQINQIPPHDVFVSGFLGECGVMQMKRPAEINIGIDRNAECVLKMRTVLENIPFIGFTDSFLQWWDQYERQSKKVFLYLDPPYLNTDTTIKYTHKFPAENHIALLERIATERLIKIMLCGYPCKFYNRMLSDWRKVEFQAWTRGHKFKTECMWMNYPEPNELHDYRFIGADYRERERITKQQNRWKRRFSDLPPLELKAMWEVLKKEKEHIERVGW